MVKVIMVKKVSLIKFMQPFSSHTCFQPHLKHLFSMEVLEGLDGEEEIKGS